jgi:mannosyltransferase OCH1-like enzyme
MEEGFSRLLFDDYQARQFISERFGPPYLTAFDRCRHPAMRCDYFRLCYMFQHGGFYVDADEFYQGADCQILFSDNNLKVQPLCYDQLTDKMVETAAFLQSRTYSPDWTFYINNNPLVSPAGHPIIRLALARSTQLLLRYRATRLDIQSTTGPGNFTASLVRHAIGSNLGGGTRDFTLLTDWEAISISRWPLSYREDYRNWRLWRPN